MWAIYALLSSVLWGLNYLMVEKVSEKISVYTIILFELFIGFIAVLYLTFIKDVYTHDLKILQSHPQVLAYLLTGVIAFVTANILIFLSINAKNATLASVIEISYPFFIALFGWILFKESNINASVLIGGALIFVGIGIIVVFNK